MAQKSILLDKALLFAARIVKLNKYLIKEKRETVISKQIIRSATSIGANANEAIYGISKADFIAKLQISLKETAETEYWLRLLVLSEYISEKEGESLLDDCLEIKKILISTLNTAKEIK
jgi:four helix bundle protein